jgi:hypothetical protein
VGQQRITPVGGHQAGVPVVDHRIEESGVGRLRGDVEGLCPPALPI